MGFCLFSFFPLWNIIHLSIHSLFSFLFCLCLGIDILSYILYHSQESERERVVRTILSKTYNHPNTFTCYNVHSYLSILIPSLSHTKRNTKQSSTQLSIILPTTDCILTTTHFASPHTLMMCPSGKKKIQNHNRCPNLRIVKNRISHCDTQHHNLLLQ